MDPMMDPLLLSIAFPSKWDNSSAWLPWALGGRGNTLSCSGTVLTGARQAFHPSSTLNIKEKSPWMLMYGIGIYSPLLFSAPRDNIN